MTKSIRQLKQKSAHSSQSGFTILESLVAIVVVAVLLSAIAPVIVLSVATRVQARRVELGTQAARAYIDGLRSGNIAPPPPATATVDPNPATFTNYAAPPTTSALTCANNDYCTTPPVTAGLYCFDGDADNICRNNKPNDLIVQAVRYNSTSVDATRGYLLGVRVYRADAFRADGNILRSTDTARKRSQSTFSGTLGPRKAPIIELTTEVKANASYDNFCQRLGGCNQ